MLTPDEIEAERQRFEAWMTAKHLNVNFRRDCTGGYEAAWVHHQWQGWLAAIASERDRRKQEQDAAEALLAMQGWPEMKHMQENGE